MFLSVIVPVYCVEESLLRACLDSLAEQKAAEIEFIIVDDASPDACGDICREYAKEDERFKVISLEENRGLSGARNAGLEHARSEYIMFVDGDDRVPAGFFEKLEEYLQRNPDDDVVFFAFTRDPDDDGFCRGMDRHALPDAVSLAESIINHEEFNRDFPEALFPSASVKVFKRSFLEKNSLRFREGPNKGEDRLFMVAVLSCEPAMSYFDCMGYVYIINPNSICHKYDPAMFSYCETACDAMEASIEQRYDEPDSARLLQALSYMRYLFLLDAERVTFFHMEGNPCFGEEEKAYRKLWKENRSLIDGCDVRLMHGKKSKLVLALKKLHLYGPAYRIECAHTKAKSN